MSEDTAALAQRIEEEIEHLSRGCRSRLSHDPTVYARRALAALVVLRERATEAEKGENVALEVLWAKKRELAAAEAGLVAAQQEAEDSKIVANDLRTSATLALRQRDESDARLVAAHTALRDIADGPCERFPNPTPFRKDSAIVWPRNCLTQRQKSPCHTCCAARAVLAGTPEG